EGALAQAEPLYVRALNIKEKLLRLSPPESEGTSFTGITGDQVPTRWRADGSSPAPTDAPTSHTRPPFLDEDAPSRACARRESARVRTCRPGQARCARRRWRPWTVLRAPGAEPLRGGPQVPGDPVEVVPCVAGGDIRRQDPAVAISLNNR